MVEHLKQPALSAREITVLTHIARGTSNRRVAEDPAVSESTVKADVASLLTKLGADDRAHAVVLALERGVIDIENLRPSR